MIQYINVRVKWNEGEYYLDADQHGVKTFPIGTPGTVSISYETLARYKTYAAEGIFWRDILTALDGAQREEY